MYKCDGDKGMPCLTAEVANEVSRELRETGFRADAVKADYLEGTRSLKEATDLLEAYGFWHDQAELWLKN